MELNYFKIAESIVILIIYLLLRGTASKVIDRTMAKRLIQKSRGKIVKKAINLTLLLLSVVLILVVWGVNHADLAVFVGSVLTVVGVALVAQWSILSNITSSIIIFFSHPVKLDDTITIMEGKEYEIQGRISNIGLFFITLKTEDKEEITLPNNIFIQKMIKIKPGQT